MMVWVVIRTEYEGDTVEGVFASPSAAAECMDRLEARNREAYGARDRVMAPIGGHRPYERLSLHVESHEVGE